jgi:hypothetical protein
MADVTYQPKTYRKQGGDEFVVASGGSIAIESGGALTNAGTLTNTGQVLDTVSASTLSAVLTNSGISTVGSSSGAASYKLAAPVAGITKTIVGYAALGGNATVTSTAATIGSTATTTITITKIGAGIQLIGMSATRWTVVGNSTGASVA